MTIENWKLWLVPLGLWGTYLCWNAGYQAGYVDGHESAWAMYQPPEILSASVDQGGNRDEADSGLVSTPHGSSND